MKIIHKIFIVLTLLAFFGKANAQLVPEFKIDKSTLCTSTPIKIQNTSGNNGFQFAHFDFDDGYDTYSIGSETIEHIYDSDGTYTIKMWLLYDDNTKSEEVSQTITIENAPTVELVDDKTTATITANVQGGVSNSFAWEFKGKPTQNDGQEVHYLESGTYVVIVTSSTGCKNSDTLAVKYLLDQEDPSKLNVIVKNNILTLGVIDGCNDVLFIEGIDEGEDYTVKIFTNKGKLVYTNTQYSNSNGFMGKDDNGNDLVAGTYYYIITCPGKKGTTGFVDILR